ncbi:hypothetical protein [Streptosporangium amethystogenes]|nr:hypothetical protein [Streptosporangium amethystogenes]
MPSIWARMAAGSADATSSAELLRETLVQQLRKRGFNGLVTISWPATN